MPELDSLKRYVHGKVMTLQRPLLSGQRSKVAGDLAALRRAVMSQPGSDSALWAHTLDGLPAGFEGHGDTPSRGEWASHLALTLYAVHQQSHGSAMHVPGISLGKALGELDRNQRTAREGATDTPLKHRFDALLTAGSLEEIRHHTRGLVQLLRQDGKPQDYGQLAADLYLIQNPLTADGVRLRWGRDFVSWGREQTTRPGAETSTAKEENAS